MTYRSASARALAFDQAVSEAMRASIPNAVDPQDPPASDPSAGTPRPEGVTVDRVAAVPAVRDTGFHPDDGDGVEHTRKARLRRWQETRG